MNDEELNAYREMFNEDTLRFIATTLMFELYGIFTEAKLTPNGRALAELLFKEEKYRNYAIERVDSVRQDASSGPNYIN